MVGTVLGAAISRNKRRGLAWALLLGSYLAASLVVGALVATGRVMDVEGLVIAAVLILAVVFLTFYVLWQRRRNGG